MIGKFTSNCGSGSNSTQNTQVREEDVQLQENYENTGITVYDMNIFPKFHNQKDINFFFISRFCIFRVLSGNLL